ncbi:hypothetical protein SCLCIDRAFT_29586 [Scleroderma citrinum Foug A]|uniref:Uncharacterized protein n=1 Tax=Scleroderma citrinum Foug A TaxID=1036808 RepID=A0A0C2ZVB4_9AGAM|nr:hypothetical protein SCLCIDRAFT_29586 [Scleroderma citrinum Foug A]
MLHLLILLHSHLDIPDTGSSTGPLSDDPDPPPSYYINSSPAPAPDPPHVTAPLSPVLASSLDEEQTTLLSTQDSPILPSSPIEPVALSSPPVHYPDVPGSPASLLPSGSPGYISPAYISSTLSQGSPPIPSLILEYHTLPAARACTLKDIPVFLPDTHPPSPPALLAHLSSPPPAVPFSLVPPPAASSPSIPGPMPTGIPHNLTTDEALRSITEQIETYEALGGTVNDDHPLVAHLHEWIHAEECCHLPIVLWISPAFILNLALAFQLKKVSMNSELVTRTMSSCMLIWLSPILRLQDLCLPMSSTKDQPILTFIPILCLLRSQSPV